MILLFLIILVVREEFTVKMQTALVLVPMSKARIAAHWVKLADGDLFSLLSYFICGLICQVLFCKTVMSPYFQTFTLNKLKGS